ncbi:MAG: hypothetical protein NVSMB66_1890 [Candidatus Doudnabacteria bacterium]
MKKIIISGLIVVLLIVGVLYFVNQKKTPATGSSNSDNNNSSNTSVNNASNDYGHQKTEPDIHEGAPLTGPGTFSGPSPAWTKNLPYFGTYYNIFWIGGNNVAIDLPNASPAIKARFKGEALDWLRSQGAPIDQLNVTTE